MHGADVDQLRSLGERMRSAADQLDALCRRTRSQLFGSPWDGREAENFRSRWEAELQPLLHRAAADMREAADLLNREAQEQLLASGATAGAPRSRAEAGTAARARADAAPELPTAADAPSRQAVVERRPRAGAVWEAVHMVDEVEGISEVGTFALYVSAIGSIDQRELGVQSAWGPLSEATANLTARLPVATAISIGADVHKLQQAWEAADWAGVTRYALDLGLSAASWFPPAAPFVMAAQTGLLIGDLVSDHAAPALSDLAWTAYEAGVPVTTVAAVGVAGDERAGAADHLSAKPGEHLTAARQPVGADVRTVNT